MDYNKMKKAELVALLEKNEDAPVAVASNMESFVKDMIASQKSSLVITKSLEKHNII